MRPVEERTEVTVVLWHGQYQNDGRERLETFKHVVRSFFGLRNVRLEGIPGQWRIIADAYLDEA